MNFNYTFGIRDYTKDNDVVNFPTDNMNKSS